MEHSRRGFLKSALAGPLLVPHYAVGANDRPVYGLIGCGNRGRSLHRTFQKLGAHCAALCDVYEPHLELARKESQGDTKYYVDHRELLAQQGLDFVVVATPDHHHAPHLFDALGAGKDVYLEKPLSHSLEESTRMLEAVRKTKQVVQVGMQRRSMPFIMRARRLIDEGMIGKISMVKAMWNWHFTLPLDNSPLPGKLDWDRFQGSAKKRPLEPMRFRWWRGFWDYSGGNMTDQGTHLMDVVQWLAGARAPLSAVCQGKVIGATGAEVPNVFSAVFDYPDFVATWTLNYRSAYEHDWSIRFQGEKGAMVLDRAGCRIYDDPGPSEAPWSQKARSDVVYMETDRDSTDLHMQNFLDCIRSRQAPNCTVEIAAAAVAGPHMANVAYREGRKVTSGQAT